MAVVSLDGIIWGSGGRERPRGSGRERGKGRETERGLKREKTRGSGERPSARGTATLLAD